MPRTSSSSRTASTSRTSNTSARSSASKSARVSTTKAGTTKTTTVVKPSAKAPSQSASKPRATAPSPSASKPATKYVPGGTITGGKTTSSVLKAQHDGIKKTLVTKQGMSKTARANVERAQDAGYMRTAKMNMGKRNLAYSKADASGKTGSAWIKEFEKAGGVKPTDISDSEFYYRATHGKYKNE